LHLFVSPGTAPRRTPKELKLLSRRGGESCRLERSGRGKL
jgi:hypothetical protein